MVQPLEDRRLLGIGFILIGYLCFTIIDTCAKFLAQNGMPPMEVVFVRYAGQFMLVAAIFLPTAGPKVLLTTRRWQLEVLRGLALLGSTILNFLAVTYLPLTVTSAISFTMPLILCVLSIPLLGETVGWRRWLAILVGFGGVMIIVQPGTAAFHPAVFLSFGCAVFTALYMLMTRKLAGVDSTKTQQFYSSMVATVCIAPFAFGAFQWPSDATNWFAFAMIGVAALVGHLFITTAHRFAPATVLAPFGYFQIIYMTAASWLVFNQPPSFWLYIGAPIVVASGLYIWLRERQLAKSIVTEVTVQD